tara:strand:- start:305 stop:655 length:351 start_codon:yes stop_codon:yes gene_type:complete
LAKNNLSNWSFKFSNIIWKFKNQDRRPTNFISNLTLNEKSYLIKNIDDIYIPFSSKGGKLFKTAFEEISYSHKIKLSKLYKSDIKYFKLELFFKESELVVKKDGVLIRCEHFFDLK